VSLVTGALLRGLHQRPHIKFTAVASRWERVGDLIGSRFEPYTSPLQKQIYTAMLWVVIVYNEKLIRSTFFKSCVTNY